MKEAVHDGVVELMGYTPWGWIDIVSAATGEMVKQTGGRTYDFPIIGATAPLYVIIHRGQRRQSRFDS